MDWLDLLAVQGTFKSLLQHHSSKASIPDYNCNQKNKKTNKKREINYKVKPVSRKESNFSENHIMSQSICVNKL